MPDGFPFGLSDVIILSLRQLSNRCCCKLQHTYRSSLLQAHYLDGTGYCHTSMMISACLLPACCLRTIFCSNRDDALLFVVRKIFQAVSMILIALSHMMYIPFPSSISTIAHGEYRMKEVSYAHHNIFYPMLCIISYHACSNDYY